MDPQSQAFTPFVHTETWRMQQDVARVQQVQSEHSERIARLERRQDDDARMKSVWGHQSPFPSVLSGTPQQAPRDRFRDFEDEANNLMSSLHLDADEEPRNPRGLGAASRANSVRFDETANQNHFAHSSRSSVDLLSRTGSSLGGLQMNERSSSYKSDGRASSAHSMRSAASGRANSLNLETGYGATDLNRSPLDTPALAPGLFWLGAVPAIIRCWMNTNFKHDALLYAAICTGSYKSYVSLKLLENLGFEDQITTEEDGITRSIELPVYFPEAVPYPASSRPSSPAPQLPTLTVSFEVFERGRIEDNEAKAIQIFIGSDTLRLHSADILLSTNSLAIFDDERNKLSVPLVRPESDAAFKTLRVVSEPSQPLSTSTTPSKKLDKAKDEPQPPLYLNGLGQDSSAASVASTAASPPPITKYRPPGALSEASSSGEPQVRFGAIGSENEARPGSRSSNLVRPSLSFVNTELDNTAETETIASQQNTPSRTGSRPAIWSSWRRDGPNQPTNAAGVSANAPLDWAAKRKETGMKVLKPKSASRTVSMTTNAAANNSPGEMRSRFFDQGSRRDGGSDAKAAATAPSSEEVFTNAAREPQPTAAYAASSNSATTPGASAATKTKSNPIGGASAFSWLNSGGMK